MSKQVKRNIGDSVLANETVRDGSVDLRLPPPHGLGHRWLVALLRAMIGGCRAADWMLHTARHPLGGPPLPDEGRCGQAGELADAAADAGPLLARNDAPELFRMVRLIGGRMGERLPRVIRVSHLPVCMLLEQTDSRQTAGHALIIGLPCFRMLTIDELRGVIGHEIAHLNQQDAGLTRSIFEFAHRLRANTNPLSRWNPRRWGAAVARAFIPRWSARLSRRVEFLADRWSADCFGADRLASALEKLAVGQPIFHEILRSYDPCEQTGQSVYSLFARVWKTMPTGTLRQIRRRILTHQSTDPFDPHPPISERLRRLNVAARIPDCSGEARLLIPKLETLESLLHNHLFGLRRTPTSVFQPERF